jgi:hypothetical protein
MRISAIVVPSILALIVAWFMFSMWQLKTDRDSLKKALDIEGPKKLLSLRVRADLANNAVVLNELEGWRRARIDWSDQLLGLQKQIPDKMQLSTLTMASELKPINNAPARLYNLALDGQAVGDTAQTLVMQLQNVLMQSSSLSNCLAATNAFKVTRFEGPENATDDNKNDRFFRIECSYKPGLF